MYALLKIIEKYSEQLFTIKKDFTEHTVFQKYQIFNEYKYSIRFDIEKCLNVPVLLSIDSSHKNDLLEFWAELVPANKMFHVKNQRKYLVEQSGYFRNVFHFEHKCLTVRDDFAIFVEDSIDEQQLISFLEIKNIDSEVVQMLRMIDSSIEMLLARNHLKFIMRNQSMYLQWFPRLIHLSEQYQQYFDGDQVLENHQGIAERLLEWINYSLGQKVPMRELEAA
jgi:hypothetical protein